MGEEALASHPHMNPTKAAILVVVALVAGLPASPAGAVITAAPDEAIAFWSARDGNREIYLAHADGLPPALLGNLTQDEREDVDPAWSFDGRRIAFARRAAGSDFEIVAMDAEGGPAAVLTSNGVDDRQPAWSPTTTGRIAFARRTSSDSSQIFTMNSSGTDVVRITPAFEGRLDSAPAWSPDGTQIAYNCGARDICIALADGTQLTRFVAAPFLVPAQPSWSPDGEWLAYGAYGVWLVEPDGSDLSQVGASGSVVAVGAHPWWSPNGKRLVFAAGDLYVVNLDGSGLTRLTQFNGYVDGAPVAATEPCWSPR